MSNFFEMKQDFKRVNKNRFLTRGMEVDINYILDNQEVRDKVYYEAELYLRAKYKLKESGLNGTTQEYERRLQTMLKTILKTSMLIEAPIEYRFPASEPAIIDILVSALENILDFNKDYIDAYIKIILDDIDYKLRRTSNAYFNHMDDIYDYEASESRSGCMLTPDSGYEIGYTLLPCAKDFIINRIAEDDDINLYMEHPLFYTNGI